MIRFLDASFDDADILRTLRRFNCDYDKTEDEHKILYNVKGENGWTLQIIYECVLQSVEKLANVIEFKISKE